MQWRRPSLGFVVAALIASVAALGTFGIEAAGQDASPQPLVNRDAVSTKEGVELRNGWRYAPGDDAAWSEPAFDDSKWESLASPRIPPGTEPESGWPGIGWFRLRVTVDPSVVGESLALTIDHPGASEIYLNGRRIGGFGTVGSTAATEETYNPGGLPLSLTFDREGVYVLAVRYSCTSSAQGFMPRILSAGFRISVRDSASSINDYTWELTLNMGVNAMLGTIMLAFGVLHLLLFTFHRGQRANLYYGMFGACFGLLIFSGLVRTGLHLGIGGSLVVVYVGRIMVACTFLSLVAFLRSAFAFDFGWWFRPLAGLWIVAVVASLLFPTVTIAFYGINVAIGLSIGASMYTIATALRGQLDGAWIIGLGAHGIAIALSAQLAAQTFNIQALWPQAIALVGFFGLPVCVSVFLARQIARTNRTLSEKLTEVERLSGQAIEHERREAEVRVQREHERAEIQLLQAENERKARELEEARQLQLSMLPAKLPEVPGVEIAAYMKPAAEVGGDYYDFHVGGDGTLTIAVGDATGHGLKAGTLVTATKGLFNAFAGELDIVGTFHRSSRALKQMNLRYLYMALTLAKLSGRTIRIGAAGMPPTLVWRAASGDVEEVALPGLPLGGAARFPYEERRLDLEAGDTVVIMSDGFPERFNEAGEMIDYSRAAAILRESGGAPPQTIIERFVAEGDTWAGRRPQDDDITFVVLRLK